MKLNMLLLFSFIFIAFSNVNDERLSLISIADTYIGTKYDRTNTKGFDCSGFVKHCYESINISAPRSSRTQAKFGQKTDIDICTVGDVIIFKGSQKSKKTPGHVGIVHHILNDTIYFIHSSVGKGVTIDHLEDPYYKARFLEIRNFF